MRSKLLCAIALLGSAAAGAGSAVAADLPVRPPGASPAAVALPTWVGFYVGINGGGGWAHTSIEQQQFESDNSAGDKFNFFVPPSANFSGGVFGFQFGHNWQWGPVVGGLEFDFDGADIKNTTTFAVDAFNTFTHEAKIDELASGRFRLGYLIIPNLLLYGTAGMGWGHFQDTTTASFDDHNGFTAFDSIRNHSDQFGWVAGVGLEWMFWNNWLLRGEWLHYDFGRTSTFDPASLASNIETNNPQTALGLSSFNERIRVDVARAALSYKFGP